MNDEEKSAAIAGVRADPACGPACQEALDHLERYIDGELPGADRTRIGRHLADCYPCTDRASFEEQLRAIVRRGCVDHAPPELLERIRAGLVTGDLRGVGPDRG